MTSTVTLFHLFLLMALANLLLPRRRNSAVAVEGLLVFMLGEASFRVAAGSPTSLTVGLAAAFGASPTFLAITTGLLLAGPMAALAAAAQAWRNQPDRTTGRRLVAVVALGLLVLGALGPIIVHAGLAATLLATLALALVAVGLHALGRALWIGTLVRYLDLHFFARYDWPSPVAVTRKDLPWSILAIGGGVLVLAPVHPAITVVGAIALVAGGHVLAMRLLGGPRFPVLPLAGAALLVLAVAMQAAANAPPWSLAPWDYAGLTTASELRLVPFIAVAAWGLGAMWPVYGVVPRGLLAPFGGAVWWRLGVGLLPAGLFFWQPLLTPLALVGVIWGALTARPTLLLTAWAFQALCTAMPNAVAGAFTLLVAAALLSLVPYAPARGKEPAATALALTALIAMAATLPAMLQTQVVYSLLAVAAAGAGVWRLRADHELVAGRV